jgi:ribokinase
MAPQVVAVIGSLMVNMTMITERVPDRGETIMAVEYFERLGGKGCNAAIAAHRTSHRKPKEIGMPANATNGSHRDTARSDGEIEVRMIGAVGDDPIAHKFRTLLKENSIDASGLVTVCDMRSSVCFVLIEKMSRENRILVTPNALEYWTPQHFLEIEALGSGVRPDLIIAQLEICKEGVERMIETAGLAGVDFLLNAAPATSITQESYRYITHLIVNETEAAILSGRELNEIVETTWPLVAQAFVELGVKNVVITLGENGAYYATAKDHGHIPAFKIEVLDTTGAGSVIHLITADSKSDSHPSDTFTGAYAANYLRQKAAGHWDIRGAILQANKAAALTVSKVGAQEGIPWLDEMDDLFLSLRRSYSDVLT